MRIATLIAAAFMFSGCTTAPSVPVRADSTNIGASIVTGFTPNNGLLSAEGVVLQAIGDSHKTIHLAAYSFTSEPVVEALIAAKRRGVDVEAVLDKSNLTANYGGASLLVAKGIPTRINSAYAIMHDKFIIIDGESVETGSFNYTKAAATRNAENVIYIRDNAEVAKTYEVEWQRLWDEAQLYRAR